MTIALIVAAGSGHRLRAGRPKAFVVVAGQTMLQWSIDAFAEMDEVERIVVALPVGAQAPAGVQGVTGGVTRSDSVRRALAAAGDGDPVIVHDAARPLLTPTLAREVTAALERDGEAAAAIAAAPVSDTIKRADEHGAVSETLARKSLWAVQTPQVFRRAALQRALDVSQEQLAAATDDAWLVERAGGKVLVVNVSGENLKVTTPLDLEMAAIVLSRRAAERS
jgi:2-C-methyl-D-erythritol 4-phosphate cytidylyltransferase